MSLAQFATNVAQMPIVAAPKVGDFQDLLWDVQDFFSDATENLAFAMADFFDWIGDIMYRIADFFDDFTDDWDYMGGMKIKPHVSEFVTSFRANLPVTRENRPKVSCPFMDADLLTIAENISAKMNERMDRLGDYIFNMWDTLSLDTFADALSDQLNDMFNTIVPMILVQAANIAGIERDFLEKVLVYISDSTMGKYKEACADKTNMKKLSVAGFICTDSVDAYIEKADKYALKTPVRAFDFAIELLTETAQCDDLMNCEFEFWDGLMDKYPEFDFDFGMSGIAGGDPMEYLF